MSHSKRGRTGEICGTIRRVVPDGRANRESQPPFEDRIREDLPDLCRRALQAAGEGDPEALRFLGLPAPKRSSHAPFGEEPGEQETVDRIRELAIEQRLPWSAVAEQLNAEGHRTRSGQSWSSHGARRVAVRHWPAQAKRSPGRPRKKNRRCA